MVYNGRNSTKIHLFQITKRYEKSESRKKKIISAPRYHGGQIVSKKFSIFFYYSYNFVHVCLFLGSLEYYSRLYCYIGQKQASALAKISEK